MLSEVELSIEIMVGAVPGAWLRYVLVSSWARRFPEYTYVGTFLVNLSGSFLMGMVFAYTQYSAHTDQLNRVVGVGILGSYTTFSGFALDMYNLLRLGRRKQAVLYGLLSIVLGLLVLELGIVMGDAGLDGLERGLTPKVRGAPAR